MACNGPLVRTNNLGGLERLFWLLTFDTHKIGFSPIQWRSFEFKVLKTFLGKILTFSPTPQKFTLLTDTFHGN